MPASFIMNSHPFYHVFYPSGGEFVSSVGRLRTLMLIAGEELESDCLESKRFENQRANLRVKNHVSTALNFNNRQPAIVNTSQKISLIFNFHPQNRHFPKQRQSLKREVLRSRILIITQLR